MPAWKTGRTAKARGGSIDEFWLNMQAVNFPCPECGAAKREQCLLGAGFLTLSPWAHEPRRALAILRWGDVGDPMPVRMKDGSYRR